MPNTLGLDDDLNPVGVVRHVERVFDITVSSDEAERIFKLSFPLSLRILPPS